MIAMGKIMDVFVFNIKISYVCLENILQVLPILPLLVITILLLLTLLTVRTNITVIVGCYCYTLFFIISFPPNLAILKILTF